MPLLAWVYESGLANFYQGLFQEQKPEGAAHTGALCLRPPVLGADERSAVAQGRSAGLAPVAAGQATESCVSQRVAMPQSDRCAVKSSRSAAGPTCPKVEVFALRKLRRRAERQAMESCVSQRGAMPQSDRCAVKSSRSAAGPTSAGNCIIPLNPSFPAGFAIATAPVADAIVRIADAFVPVADAFITFANALEAIAHAVATVANALVPSADASVMFAHATALSAHAIVWMASASVAVASAIVPVADAFLPSAVNDSHSP